MGEPLHGRGPPYRPVLRRLAVAPGDLEAAAPSSYLDLPAAPKLQREPASTGADAVGMNRPNDYARRSEQSIESAASAAGDERRDALLIAQACATLAVASSLAGGDDAPLT